MAESSGQQLERMERGTENVVGLPRRLKKIARSEYLRDQGNENSFKICKSIFSVCMVDGRYAEGAFRLDIWKIFSAVRTGYTIICQNSLVRSCSCLETVGWARQSSETPSRTPWLFSLTDNLGLPAGTNLQSFLAFFTWKEPSGFCGKK